MREPRFNYEPIAGRRRLEMPNGARVAVWVGINVEYHDFNKPAPSIPGVARPIPSPRDYGWVNYGLRVGVFRIMDILDRYGMRGSVLLNSDVCDHFPEVIQAGNEHGWVWLAHGKNQQSQTEFEYHAEVKYLREHIEAVEKGTGQRPNGWLGPGLSESWNTPDILAELGLTYVCDWTADDQPFPLRVKTGKMINVPYPIDGLNDRRLVDRAFTGADYRALILEQFETLYRDGESNPRVMGIAIHPYITGQPFRASGFDAALEHIAAQPDVWLTTSDEIAAWYYDHYYETPE